MDKFLYEEIKAYLAELAIKKKRVDVVLLDEKTAYLLKDFSEFDQKEKLFRVF